MDTLTVFSVYGALVISKQSCFSVFDNALVNSFTTNVYEQKTEAEKAAAIAACNTILRKTT